MRFTRLSFVLALAPLALAACGGSGGYSSSSGSAPSPSTAASPAPAASPAAAAPAALIALATATVAGKSEPVLTDSQGLTLYYRTSDTASKVGCVSGCAAAWPPLLLASGTPTGPSSATGALTTIDGPNGRQVEYSGHPLYRFAQDAAAGDTKGEGFGGVWHVAIPGLT